MTKKDEIIKFLKDNPNGIDDDKLSIVLGLKHRQQANSICRQLEIEGLIKRPQVNGKIQNFWIGNKKNIDISYSIQEDNNQKSDEHLWFWEGNIQLKVVDYLVASGFEILSIANTASHERGVDIIARLKKKELWITVKGYPTGTDRTNPTTQASHWFKEAVFDIIDYRNQNINLDLGIALPNCKRYHSLSEKTSWLKNVSGFRFYWVDEYGKLSIE